MITKIYEEFEKVIIKKINLINNQVDKFLFLTEIKNDIEDEIEYKKRSIYKMLYQIDYNTSYFENIKKYQEKQLIRSVGNLQRKLESIKNLISIYNNNNNNKLFNKPTSNKLF